jgi:hypothetical protein
MSPAMLLKLFSSNRTGVFIIIILLPALYWLSDLLPGIPLHGSVYDGTFFGGMIQNFNLHFRILAQIIAVVMILGNAYLLVLLNKIHIFIPVRTQQPALFYVMLTACFNPLHQLTAVLVASSLLIFVLYRLISTYKAEGISYNYLDAGFMIALAGLIYLPSLIFFFMLIAGLTLLRPFNWREWAYSLIGLCLPFLFLFSGYFLAGRPVSDYFPGLAGLFSRNKQNFEMMQVISWVYIFAMLLYGSYFMVATIDNMKIQGRKIFMLFLWFFVLSAVIYLAIPGSGIEMISIAAIPVSFLFSHYFYKCKKNWINEILFSVFLILILLLRIF